MFVAQETKKEERREMSLKRLWARLARPWRGQEKLLKSFMS